MRFFFKQIVNITNRNILSLSLIKQRFLSEYVTKTFLFFIDSVLLFLMVYLIIGLVQFDSIVLKVFCTLFVLLALYLFFLFFSLLYYEFFPEYRKNDLIAFQEDSSIREEKNLPNFNISISDFQLRKLYNELVRYQFIIDNLTSYEDFYNVLKKNWDAHNSLLHFNFDAPSCREFFENLKTNYSQSKLSMIDFFDRSNLIKRADGKNYNYNTIRNSKIRTPISSKSEMIKSIFFALHQ